MPLGKVSVVRTLAHDAAISSTGIHGLPGAGKVSDTHSKLQAKASLGQRHRVAETPSRKGRGV